MTNPNKRKGDKAEREAAEVLTKVTGFECKRNLAAGIPDDVGDIYGIPNCVVQVCDYKDKSRACLVKPREVETQRINAGVRAEGLTYAKFIHGLAKSKIKLDRKVLAELAYNNPEVFKSVVKKVQSSLN